MMNSSFLHEDALVVLVGWSHPSDGEGGPGRVLEHLLHAFACPGRALEIFVGVDLLGDSVSFFRGNGLLVCLAELLDRLGIVTQILFAANEEDGETSAEVQDLSNPLLLNVIKRVRCVDGEADQDDMRIGVRQGTETVIIFLTSGIPQGELDVLSLHFDIRNVVLEDSRNVHLRELALREHDQQTGFTTGTISNDDQLAADFSHLYDETEGYGKRLRKKLRKG